MERKMTYLGRCLGATAVLFAACPAYAEPKVHDYVLIVANNKSLSLSQPDLQYADDDGARYYRLFRGLTGDTDIALLTQFDRASLALYPDLATVAQAPSREALERAVSKLAAAIELARSRGEKTRFYFVYAGHGDVSEGRGYLELQDSRVDGDFIEHRIIERISADNIHLLLDSCNSFFVISPRKPGGRRWATPKDMALGFSARHPEVGLFLSTNSESEVFEWSEVESGVFSHEVRSGLSGGADVNADGNVSYLELAGFVDNANRSIARESLRPHLFYRGPHGDPDAALFSTTSMTGRRITLDDVAGRLWVKNETGGRIIDINKEPGPLTLVVPEVGSLSIFQEHRTLAEFKPSIFERYVAAGDSPIALAALERKIPAIGARGDRLFGNLFAAPYGPIAYAQFVKTAVTSPEPVYGLSESDLTRMDNYLVALAGQDRTQRNSLSFITAGLGTLGAGATTGLLLHRESRREYPYGILGLGALSLGAIGTGIYYGLTKSKGEEALDSFRFELKQRRANPAQLFVRTESWLARVAEHENARRNAFFWAFEGMAGGFAALATASAIHPDRSESNPYLTPAILYSESLFLAAAGIFVLTQSTPTERMLRLYREDPGLKLNFNFAPTQSAVTLGLSGAF